MGNPKKRQSRHKRSNNPNHMILQKRDIDILSAVFDYRYLSRSQIQELFDINTATRINIRLRKLYDNKFLDRYYKPVLLGSSEAIYTLGLNACSVIAEKNKLEIEEVKRRRRLDQISKSKFFEHNMIVNDFRIKLLNDLKSTNSISSIRWEDARDCEVKFEYRKDGKNVISSIKPDGYVEYLYQNKIYSFYVEIDLSTSSHSKLKEKIDNYIQFKKNNLFNQKKGRHNFYILFIAKTQARSNNLHQVLSHFDTDIFWFTYLDQFENNLLFDPVWLRSSQSGVRSIFQKPKVRILK